MISSATTGSREKALVVNDVSRAYMYAPCDEDVYVELCDEDREAGEEQMCGKLSKAMYGTRIAAKMWQREAGNTLKGAGFTAGRTSPCLFHHPARDMMVFLHGDVQEHTSIIHISSIIVAHRPVYVRLALWFLHHPAWMESHTGGSRLTPTVHPC